MFSVNELEVLNIGKHSFPNQQISWQYIAFSNPPGVRELLIYFAWFPWESFKPIRQESTPFVVLNDSEISLNIRRRVSMELDYFSSFFFSGQYTAILSDVLYEFSCSGGLIRKIILIIFLHKAKRHLLVCLRK